MEACLGRELFEMMSDRAVGKVERRGYIQQVSQAVGYLHGINIIHRDIKHLLIDHSGTAKLCDFGWVVYAPLMRDTRSGTPL
jgi:serine/threonine protein kinase